MENFPVISVGGWSSTCLNCNKGAHPEEKTHVRVIGYGSKDDEIGCGIEWTKITDLYGNNVESEASKRLRPDLEWLDPWSKEVIERVTKPTPKL